MTDDLLERYLGFTVLDPWLLLLGLLVPLAFLVRRLLRAPAVRFAPGGFLAGVPATWRVRLLPLPAWLSALGLALLVVALARPVHRSRIPLRTEGIDIMLTVDLSSSMAETDMDRARRRSRLDVVKEAAGRFIDGRKDDRVGLLTFARYADVRCPPTLDHGALRKFLSEVKLVPQNSEEDGTAIGLSTVRACQVLKRSEVKSKVLIVLTDGQETVAPREGKDAIWPHMASRLAKEFGIRIYAIAAGVGSMTPLGFVRTIDHGELKAMAEKTGGEFYKADDAEALQAVYAEIDRLEKVKLKEPRFKVEERFLAFLWAGLASLLAALLLRGTVLQVLP